MGIYLIEMGDWLRAAGLVVVEYRDWQLRARSSGGFTGNRPWCVMWHHTASVADPEDDDAYCAEGDTDAPLANLTVHRDGSIGLLAAGATNTNGKGYSMMFSRGWVPDDQMNTHAIGMEICNNGVGEVYPRDQIDAAFTASLALCEALALNADDLATHAEWAPDRKIDPAVAFAVGGPWVPTAINSSGTWSLPDLRAEALSRASGPLPAPTPPPIDPAPPLTKDDDTMIVALDSNGTAWIGDGVTRFAPTEAVFNNYVILGKSGCYRFVNTSGGVVSGWPDVRTVGEDTIQALGVAS